MVCAPGALTTLLCSNVRKPLRSFPTQSPHIIVDIRLSSTTPSTIPFHPTSANLTPRGPRSSQSGVRPHPSLGPLHRPLPTETQWRHRSRRGPHPQTLRNSQADSPHSQRRNAERRPLSPPPYSRFPARGEQSMNRPHRRTYPTSHPHPSAPHRY